MQKIFLVDPIITELKRKICAVSLIIFPYSCSHLLRCSNYIKWVYWLILYPSITKEHGKYIAMLRSSDNIKGQVHSVSICHYIDNQMVNNLVHPYICHSSCVVQKSEMVGNLVIFSTTIRLYTWSLHIGPDISYSYTVDQ